MIWETQHISLLECEKVGWVLRLCTEHWLYRWTGGSAPKLLLKLAEMESRFRFGGHCYIHIKDHQDQHSLLFRWNKLPWWFMDNKVRNIYWDSSPKYENDVIINSPSCCSKPIRPSLILGTQIKIFFMKSMSFLTLHRLQQNYHIQGPETEQGHRPWHQWFNHKFMKLWGFIQFIQKFLLFRVSLQCAFRFSFLGELYL